MPKTLNIEQLRLKVFKTFVGKLNITSIQNDKNKIEVVCNACQFPYVIPINFTIKSVPKWACKKCDFNYKQERFTEAQKQLAYYMQENLRFTEWQLCNFFSIKKQDLIHLKPEHPYDRKGKSLIVMGIDPGTLNAGLSIVKIKGFNHVKSVKPLYSKMLVNTFKTFNSFDFEYKFSLLVAEIQVLINKYHPDVLVIERYQSRGGFSNASNETVNMIITYLISALGRQFSMFKILTSSGWKARVNAVFDLKQEYKKITPLPTHIVDSVFQAASVFPDKENPFKWLNKPKTRAKFYRKILAVSPQITYKIKD